MAELHLSEEQITTFQRDGYLLIRSLFDTEELELLSSILHSDRRMEGAHERPDSEGGVSRLRVMNELGDDLYSTIVRCRRTAATMTTLLGDEVYHWHHKVMLKEPRVGGAWEWHQDYGYWYRNNHCLFPDMGSCMIAVDRAIKENGCLQVISGSHQCGRIEHGTTGGQVGADLNRVEALLKCMPLVHCEMDPGDALFFHANILHRSDQNRSEHPRWSLICCYNTKHNDPFKQPSHHPAYAPMSICGDEEVKNVGQRQQTATVNRWPASTEHP